MSIEVTANKKSVIIELSKENNFSDIVAVMHKVQAKYKDKKWYINPYKYEEVYEELSDITQIHEVPNFRNNLWMLLMPQSDIEKYRFPVDVSKFKVQPIIGKIPYEDYQLQDIIKTVSTNRFALFSDMGVGKSYIIITALELLKKHKGLKKIVMVTSSSGTYNIMKEFENFSDIDIGSIAIGDINNRRPFDDDTKNIIIMNYRSFLLISDEYRKEKDVSKAYRSCPLPLTKWLDGDVGAIILDESHNISNPSSRQSKVLHLAAPYFKYRYIMTGTPFDREWKLYSQLRFLDFSLVQGMNYQEWCQFYFYPDKYSEYKAGEIKPEKAIELQAIVKTISVRRFAKDVLNLPENFINNYYVQFTPEHRNIYQDVVMATLNKLKKDKSYLETREVVNIFQYLLLAIDNPHLLLNSDYFDAENTKQISSFKFQHSHSKVQAVLDLLEKWQDSKVVIWTSHPSVGQILNDILHTYNPLLLNGESVIPKGFTRDSYKLYVVDKFQTGKHHQILIAGEQVLNTAITMVEPNVQIYFDTDFNYTSRSQSEKRIYRIGQKQDVYTYNLIMGRSLDVVRAKNLKDKDFLNNNFLNLKYLDLKMAQQLFMMETL